MENLHDIDAWEKFREKHDQKEIIIFKFSPTCPVSRSVEHDFDSWYIKQDDSEIVCAKVDVIRARPLSQHLAREFDVRHESPQVLWLDGDGNVKWSASHHQISREALESNLQGSKA